MKQLLGLACACSSLLLAGSAFGGIIYVPTDYSEIHDAVQACPAGDTVIVAAGTYTDVTHETEGPGSTPASVIMKSGVTLRGAGKDATIIDAAGPDTRGIFIEAVSNCRVENLQVRNAFAEVYGAGILIRNVDATVELNDVKIYNNFDGGIVCITSASPVMRRMEFLDNSAKQGGGLAIEESSDAQLYDSSFINNQSPSGGAVIIRNNCNAIIDNCLFDSNFTNANFGNGGAIAAIGCSPAISNCSFLNNSTLGNGGGVAFLGNAGGSLTNCLIQGNSTDYNFGLGGGVHLDESNPLISFCTIVENDNNSFQGLGGGVSILFVPAPTLRNCTIAGNSIEASGTGGGLYIDSSPAVVDKCIVANSLVGEGIACAFATPVISCTDVWGNAGGDALCGTDAGGNFSADPLFCGAGEDEPYGLGEDSPCIAGNHPGGAGTCDDDLIGAGPANCGTGVPAIAFGAARLLGNAPNPFNPKTAIFFVIDEPARVSFRIYDIAGRTVANLPQGELPAGQHEVTWNGRHANGEQAASGVYLYEMEALGEIHSRRMILVK